VQIGLVLSQDTPIEAFADRLRARGVEVSDIIESEAGHDINFADPDGTPIYVGDWDPDFGAVPGESVEERLSRQEEDQCPAFWALTAMLDGRIFNVDTWRPPRKLQNGATVWACDCQSLSRARHSSTKATPSTCRSTMGRF
jgi:hypothetical protein